MKNLRQIAWGSAFIATFVVLTHSALAHGNDRGTATATIGGAHVTIDYGRPSLRGRDPLSLIKPGGVWRMGSDAPTTLETDHNLMVGGVKIPPGTYIILARYDAPGHWSLVFSKAPYSQYTANALIAETPMTFASAENPTETVTITLADKKNTGVMRVAWGKMLLWATFAPTS